MKITTEINDYSEPAKPSIRIHNHWNIGRYDKARGSNFCPNCGADMRGKQP